MTARSFTAPVTGPVTMLLHCGMAYVTASTGARTATAEVTGPQDVVDGIRDRAASREWAITLPDGPDGGTTVFGSGGVTPPRVRARSVSGRVQAQGSDY